MGKMEGLRRKFVHLTVIGNYSLPRNKGILFRFPMDAKLASELNKGGKITSGLKNVTDDMKTKNKKQRSGLVKAKSKGGSNIARTTPVLEKQGKKWVIEGQVGKRILLNFNFRWFR